MSRRNEPDIPGAIRSTVTPMLIADVVKVRLEIERRIGAVLDSIELLSQTRIGGRRLGDFVLELRWNVKLVDRQGSTSERKRIQGKPSANGGSRHPRALLIGSSLDLTSITWLFDV